MVLLAVLDTRDIPASSKHGSRLKTGSKTSLVYLHGAPWLLQDLPAAGSHGHHPLQEPARRRWYLTQGHKNQPQAEFPSLQIINAQYDSSSKLGAVTVLTLCWGFSFCSYSQNPPRSAGSSHSNTGHHWIPAYPGQPSWQQTPQPRAGFSPAEISHPHSGDGLPVWLHQLCLWPGIPCRNNWHAPSLHHLHLFLETSTTSGDSSLWLCPLGAEGQKFSVATDCT